MTNNTTKNATPRPWTIDKNGTDSVENMAEQIKKGDWMAIGIEDREGYAESVAYCHPNNAALIVRAVNRDHVFEELLEVASAILVIQDEGEHIHKGTWETLRNAITNANKYREGR